MEPSFVRNVEIQATPGSIFDAITTLEGLRGWWMTRVEGRPLDGEVRFELDGQHIIMHVDEASQRGTVKWTCRVHSALPEWKDTQIIWDLRATGSNRCELRLEHVGLVPTLQCYGRCEVGWDRVLESIVSYVNRSTLRASP
jgi:uncharacterized protein YndB with AHSA1/START domain